LPLDFRQLVLRISWRCLFISLVKIFAPALPRLFLMSDLTSSHQFLADAWPVVVLMASYLRSHSVASVWRKVA
jgi:hypothetical protein